jgi:Acetyltransferase (GNAT) domain
MICPDTALNNLKMTQNNTISYRFSYKIKEIAADWSAAMPSDNLFLQPEYLQILESNPPVGMRFAYLVFYKNQSPIGVAYGQIKHFAANENIRDGMESDAKNPCFFDGLFRWMKRRVGGIISANVLICGNMLLTGENGYFYDNQQVTQDDFFINLEKGLVGVIADLEQKGTQVLGILHKDLFEKNRAIGQKYWIKNGFVEFDIQPNMILEIRPNWENFDQYLAAMEKKYRTRTRRAFTKKAGIELREFSTEEVFERQTEMYQLYRAIAKNAGFNMVDLNADYLPNLKKNLGENCQFFGYFMEHQLVAFFSIIKNGAELEAHFLGYDQLLNHEHQIYLNILYDIVRLGIDGKFEKIIFARTALEIKSSIGAEPFQMFCHLRHQNTFMNNFTSRALDFLKPVEKWTQRRPFDA